ncbi:MAG: MATE family efflux transporter [Bacteroidales bacterium]
MKDLTDGNEGKLILRFAIPMLVGNVFQQLYNVVDSIVIGHFVGKEALAAVGASFPFIFVLVALVIGVGMGFSIVISQFFGAKQMDKVKETMDTMWIFLFWSGLVTTFLGIILTRPILELTGLPAEVMPYAVTYLHIYMGGNLFFFGFNGMTSLLRGIGDSTTPLWFLIISTIVNIVLDLLFVIVFGWGISGVAVATLLAQAGAFITMVWWINRTHKLINLSFRKFVYDAAIMRKSLQIGLPSGVQHTVFSLGMLAIYGIVNRFGTDTVAAYSAAGRIDSLATMPAMNLSAALSSFAGQNIGAGRTDRVRNGLRATLKMSTIIAIAGTIVFWLFGPQLMKIFTTDPVVVSKGAEYLRIVASFYILLTTMFTINGMLRGAGDTLIPMFVTLLSLWIIRVPLSYWLSGLWGEKGIWWAIPLAWIFGVLASYSYYKTGRWKRKAVVNKSGQ